MVNGAAGLPTAAGIKPLDETSSRLQPNVGQSLEGREGRMAPGNAPYRSALTQLTFAKAEFTVLAGREVVERTETPTPRSHPSAARPRGA
jgi:hypothetical protein